MGDRMDKDPYPWRQQIVLEIKKWGGGALESDLQDFRLF